MKFSRDFYGTGYLGARTFTNRKRVGQKMELYEQKEHVERVILVGIQTGDSDPAEASLDELGELAKTAGAVVVGRMIQNREQMHPATYIGKGKILELKEMIWETDATGIICDDELSSAQLGNLEQELECKVMDRRLIRERISRLKKELKEVEQHRELIRTQRKESHRKVAALVGYTSAGKSSIENALTGAGILEDAMLFSTLDTTTRALELGGKQTVLLTDTVGFIRKLPHHLVEAFKSTLEEAIYADIIIHVVDASNPQMDTQMYVVYETLRQLGVKEKPIVTLFNKQDQVETPGAFRDFQADYTVCTSARTGEGLEELKQVLLEILRKDLVYVERLYPFPEAGKIQRIREIGELLEEEYVPEGIQIKAYVPYGF